MRQVPPWRSYDRLASTGEYGPSQAEVSPPAEGPDEAAFFRTALARCRRVLDLGCGPGVLGPHEAWRCGLDASPAMLGLAQRSTGGQERVCLVRGLAETLPFAAGSFDGAVLSGSLCSVPDPAPVLAEVARATAPGALVAVLVWEFASVLAGQGPRPGRSLRRDGDRLFLQVVQYLSGPYRIGHTRYLLDPRHGFTVALRGEPESPPTDPPTGAILETTYEEEAQFDPQTLEAAFARVGFAVVELRVAISFDTPHIFAVFRKG